MMEKTQQLLNYLEGVAAMANQALNEVNREYDHSNGHKKVELRRLQQALEDYKYLQLNDLRDKIDFTLNSNRRITGPLRKGQNGRFYLDKADEMFTSGSEIEVFIDDQEDYDHGWNYGRVEYAHSGKLEGYYFFNCSGRDHHPLKPGMLAGIRR